ncbi:unnamed protein product [Vitrella brassicaformis CCMP3155]|uniref:RRM domain-containing protein n=2 Tax=Vitrella brassicaformis TaxID=1169539 RepID=A0A0G4FTR8_VITBC|nr:unnamed protein product [Vitrella brassicaformis CCMP3155]|eukprot:CEM17816.1 unnamed protein product [Vitrella brassicaformis CCMP3155]
MHREPPPPYASSHDSPPSFQQPPRLPAPSPALPHHPRPRPPPPQYSHPTPSFSQAPAPAPALAATPPHGHSAPPAPRPLPDNVLTSSPVKTFVNRLPVGISERQLFDVFNRCGVVLDVHILTNSPNRPTTRGPNSRTCAFVRFQTVQHALAAMEQLHGKCVLNQSAGAIQVRFAEGEMERLGIPPQMQPGGEAAKIFVGSLPKSVTDRQLGAVFEQFGAVDEVWIMRDSQGESKCAAFVTMPDREEAASAIVQLDKKLIMPNGRRPIEVRLATSKGDRMRQASYPRSQSSSSSLCSRPQPSPPPSESPYGLHVPYPYQQEQPRPAGFFGSLPRGQGGMPMDLYEPGGVSAREKPGLALDIPFSSRLPPSLPDPQPPQPPPRPWPLPPRPSEPFSGTPVHQFGPADYLASQQRQRGVRPYYEREPEHRQRMPSLPSQSSSSARTSVFSASSGLGRGQGRAPSAASTTGCRAGSFLLGLPVLPPEREGYLQRPPLRLACLPYQSDGDRNARLFFGFSRDDVPEDPPPKYMEKPPSYDMERERGMDVDAGVGETSVGAVSDSWLGG